MLALTHVYLNTGSSLKNRLKCCIEFLSERVGGRGGHPDGTPAVLVTQLCCLLESHLQLESSWTSYFLLALLDHDYALFCHLSCDGSGPETPRVSQTRQFANLAGAGAALGNFLV